MNNSFSQCIITNIVSLKLWENYFNYFNCLSSSDSSSNIWLYENREGVTFINFDINLQNSCTLLTYLAFNSFLFVYFCMNSLAMCITNTRFFYGRVGLYPQFNSTLYSNKFNSVSTLVTCLFCLLIKIVFTQHVCHQIWLLCYCGICLKLWRF